MLIGPWVSDRVQRLKDARTEAVKEIDALKAQKNVEYKAYEAEASIPCAMLINHSGETDQSLAQTQQQTEQSIAEIRKAFAENKDTVIAKLLDSVVNVQPTVHQNAKV
ncbi:hypothetical protein BZG36_03101 [Bifiguratus adelaidae]|uniref:V-type proton ATPase subunit G n=1 Tax=Bifiguratus adelaidae TaxID=1938954 RepID=A0A261XYZ9_9FUNG|nr:hypothetical protein BZG36_03101 [Bifiguratus adelaidae]